MSRIPQDPSWSGTPEPSEAPDTTGPDASDASDACPPYGSPFRIPQLNTTSAPISRRTKTREVIQSLVAKIGTKLAMLAGEAA